MSTERTCFLCGGPIGGKATAEHVFANPFLGEFGLKREKLRFGAPNPIEYDRLKVPANIVDTSRAGLLDRPPIDESAVNRRANEWFKYLASRLVDGSHILN
jgi:hypothetical protein